MGVPLARRGRRAPLRDVGYVAAGPHRLVCWLARVPLVRAEVLAHPPRRGARDDEAIQCGLKVHHVMPLGPAHDEGQRDSIPVDEEAALGPFFSPGPSGSARRSPGRAAP